jgi:hypothetical protein
MIYAAIVAMLLGVRVARWIARRQATAAARPAPVRT